MFLTELIFFSFSFCLISGGSTSPVCVVRSRSGRLDTCWTSQQNTHRQRSWVGVSHCQLFQTSLESWWQRNVARQCGLWDYWHWWKSSSLHFLGSGGSPVSRHRYSPSTISRKWVCLNTIHKNCSYVARNKKYAFFFTIFFYYSALNNRQLTFFCLVVKSEMIPKLTFCRHWRVYIVV